MMAGNNIVILSKNVKKYYEENIYIVNNCLPVHELL